MSDNILDTDKEKLLEMPPLVNPPLHVPRLKAMAVAALIVSGIVYGVLRDEEGVMHVFRERSRLQELSHSVNSLRDENNQLRSEIKSLREDPRDISLRRARNLTETPPKHVQSLRRADFASLWRCAIQRFQQDDS